MTKINLDLTIGTKLKEFRVAKGYTQMDVVRKLNLYGSNMSESTYSKIEQGVRNIYLTDLILLKIVLELNYDELFGEFETELLKIIKSD